jgi:formylglycine-generating enzyme required for sulfatase activity/energy-coupling factor transporter ATP-binding protein EcfA2
MSDDLARRLRNLRESLESGDIDAAAYEGGLTRLRATYGADAVNALLSRQASVSPPVPGIAVQISTDSGSISGAPVSVVGHADQVTFPTPPDPTLAREDRALLAYLQHLVGECRAVPLGQLDRTDADRTRPVELARVYIGLHTIDQLELSKPELAELITERQALGRDAHPSRPLSALEALSRSEEHRLMLLGAPGSGKSTFVSHLALCLAEANLRLRRANEAEPAVGWLARLPGWSHGPLLPVRLILRDLAAFGPLTDAVRGSVRLLEAYLVTMLHDAGCPDALEALRAALRDGTALLLIDGLDEVVGDPILARIGQCIEAAARSYRAPILVTCRVLDYQEEPQRQLPGFPTRTLADLDDRQVRQFVQDWYAGLAASGRRTPAQAAERANALRAAVDDRDELRSLAGSPLLLTVMALVHAFKGRLPDSRAQLYAECVDLLLLRWRQPDAGPDLLRRLGLSEFKDNDLKAMMARLGFTAHQKAERAPGDTRPADLTEDEVIGVLAEEFARYDPQRKRALAEVVFHALAHGNGLLLKRGPDAYAFPHRTFQEFLAGQHLKSQQREYLRLCRELAPLPHWHEPLTLMVGFQVLEDGEIERPLLLADQLLERGPQAQVLAGELLVLIGRERAARYSQEESRRIWPRALKVLRALSATGRAPDAPATLRARAGLALGQLCYGGLEALSRPASPALLPDPRLPFAMLGAPFERDPSWQHCLERYWCPIAPGPFWSGDDSSEQLASAEIFTPYQIARYPVTNADYARFLVANGPNGYDPAMPWWTEYGRAYLLSDARCHRGESEQITYPRVWSLARYNGPLQPVVGVTCYEAAAYCRWLTTKGHAGGWLPADEVIRLPSWHEWERAARHTDQRRCPWGNDRPDPERANYGDVGLGAPSPIGCFPAGAAVCSAEDMVGNVREWTASQSQRWDEWEKDFADNALVTVSYTYFNDSADVLCCDAHGWSSPYGWDNFLGFRVVQSRAPTE